MKSVYIVQEKLKNLIYSKVLQHTFNYKNLNNPTAASRPFFQAFVHCVEIHLQNKPYSLQSVFPRERGQTAQLQSSSSVWVAFSQTAGRKKYLRNILQLY